MGNFGIQSRLLVLVALAACQAPNPAYHLAMDPIVDAGATDAGATADGRTDAAASTDNRATDAPSATVAMDGPVAAVPPIVKCPADPNLAACFRFEGNLKDESMSDLVCQVSNLAFEAGKDGQALHATEQTRIGLTQSTSLLLQRFTIEVWFRPSALPAPGVRSGLVDNQGVFGMFLMPDGSVVCTSSNQIVTTAPGATPAGTWASLACVSGDATLALWRDGVLVASAAQSTRALPRTSGMVIAGNRIDAFMMGPDPLVGAMDNLRIWKTVRTPAEICAAALNCPP